MKNYILKEKTKVQAIQFNGQQILDGRIVAPSIHWSLDKKLYYIANTLGMKGGAWMSVDKQEDGKYKLLPFNQWKVETARPTETEPVEKFPELTERYLNAFDAELMPAFILLGEGEKIRVSEGEWLLYKYGELSAMTNKDFVAEYEEILIL